MELHGVWARFAVRDITFPSPDAVLRALHEHDVISGRVVDVSDSGHTQDAFVVVSVEGLEQPVVVAVANVQLRRRD